MPFEDNLDLSFNDHDVSTLEVLSTAFYAF